RYDRLCLVDATIVEHQLDHHAHFLASRPGLPRQYQRVSGAQQAASPPATQLVRRNEPGAYRPLDAFLGDLQRLHTQRTGRLDHASVWIMRLDNHLQGFVARLVVVIITARSPAYRDGSKRVSLRRLLRGERTRRALANYRQFLLQRIVVGLGAE